MSRSKSVGTFRSVPRRPSGAAVAARLPSVPLPLAEGLEHVELGVVLGLAASPILGSHHLEVKPDAKHHGVGFDPVLLEQPVWDPDAAALSNGTVAVRANT